MPLPTLVLWKQSFIFGKLFGLLNQIINMLQLISLHKNHCIFHSNFLMLVNCSRKRIDGSQVLKSVIKFYSTEHFTILCKTMGLIPITGKKRTICSSTQISYITLIKTVARSECYQDVICQFSFFGLNSGPCTCQQALYY